MIKRSLRKLRQQPKSTRDNIALAFAGSLTGIVALVWLYHAPVRIGEGTAGIVSGGSESEQPGFMNIFSDFGSQMATVKESFNDIQEITTEEEVAEPVVEQESQTNQTNSYEEDVAQAEEINVATSTTQARTVRIITTNEDSSDVDTSERQ